MEKPVFDNSIVNDFLLGRDPMERIINIECGYQDSSVKIIYKTTEGKRATTSEPYYPFIWAKRSTCENLCGGDRKQIQNLLNKYGIGVKALITHYDGYEPAERMEKGYCFMFYALNPMPYNKFLKFFEDAGKPVYNNNKNQNQQTPAPISTVREYLAVSPVEQFMMQTGKRLFKGYDDYDELIRMEFDLETEGLDARRHRINQIGVRTNKGFETIIKIGNGPDDEIKGIVEFFELIAQYEPDVLIGYNSENFDWDFIITRCEVLGYSIEELSKRYFGGNSIYKKKKPTALKLGGEMEYFRQTIVPGYNVIDALHAVRRAQALDSNMENASLKYITQYISANKTNRVYVPGDKIKTIWADTEKNYAFNNENGDWYKTSVVKPIVDGYEFVTGTYIVERYLLDDLVETDTVELHFNQANFLLSKWVPTSFGRICTMGSASVWRVLMLAWSYENNLAIPAEGKKRKFTGGLSRLLSVGYAPNIVKLDYGSLYPSIKLTWDIKSNLDITEVLLLFLEFILTNRELYKGLKKKAAKKKTSIETELKSLLNDEKTYKKLYKDFLKWANEESKNDKKQLPLKVMGNSEFGASAAEDTFNWALLDCAEKTTCIGRQCLRLANKFFQPLGYKSIVMDSVTYDTPILVRDKDTKSINILPICDVFNESNGIEFNDEQYRDFSPKPYDVLTRNGWQNIDYVYKHKTEKQLHRVETKNGLIDVTEDHSLFNNFKEEVQPKNLKRGDKIEIYTKSVDYTQKEDDISEKEAWLFGFFMADGSSVYCDRKTKYFSKRKNDFVFYNTKRANWKISNQSTDRLNKAKKIMKEVYGFNKIDIKEHMKSSHVYNLVVENTNLAKRYSDIFYTSYRYKKVPEIILNAPLEIKKAFIDGFCCGDGQSDTLDICVEFGQKSKVAMAGLYFILKELDINFRIRTRSDKPEFISFIFRNQRGNLLNEDYSNKREYEVWNNKNITSKSEFVYDISADGTFINALGMITCHNTDGVNLTMPNIFRYTKENPYIGKGLNRAVEKGKEYEGVAGDVAEFNDLYMRKKMQLGIDEFCLASCSCSRKNYFERLENGDIKVVGNSLKSKKTPSYIKSFKNKSYELLLDNKGREFLEEYYSYVEKIYNYQIPLRDIATKARVKRSVEEYKKDMKTMTKAGRPKSRQAHMELVINNNLKVDIGDTIYYVNTGKSKSHADVKKVAHYFKKENGEKIEVTKEITKEFKLFKKENKNSTINIEDFAKDRGISKEDEIIMNCVYIPTEVIEAENDTFCDENTEYNVQKYIEQFNKAIKPLLVCFDQSIRSEILITNPEDKKYYTEEQAKLTSGQPYKRGDQDTYEDLMIPEDKEVRYWLSVNEKPPFVDECEIDWDGVVADYKFRLEEIKRLNIEQTFEDYNNAIEHLTEEEVEDFRENGVLPASILKIVREDPLSNNLLHKEYDVVVGTILDIYDKEVFDEYDPEIEVIYE